MDQTLMAILGYLFQLDQEVTKLRVENADLKRQIIQLQVPARPPAESEPNDQKE